VLHWFNPDVQEPAVLGSIPTTSFAAAVSSEDTNTHAAADAAAVSAKEATDASAAVSTENGVYDNVPIFVWEPKGGVEFYGFPTQNSGTCSSSSTSSSSCSEGEAAPQRVLSGVKVAMHGGRGVIPGAQLNQPEDLRSAPRPSSPTPSTSASAPSSTEEDRDKFDESKPYINDKCYAGPVASDAEIAAFRAALSDKLPLLAAAQHVASVVCMYTFTPNQHFLIDWHPKHSGSLLLVSPCSGHGA